MRESELEESEVKMVSLISFHGIFSTEYSKPDDIDKIYKINPNDGHGSCDLPSGDDR